MTRTLYHSIIRWHGFGVGLVLILFVMGQARAAEHPNVILILTDDQGYSDVGYSGNPWLETPVLDELASKATVFDRFYASPVCSPTRAGLMTGRYAFRTGVTDTQSGASILRPQETTIAESLRAGGYRTGLFGKWHLGDNAPSRPIDQGFDHYLTHVGGMIGMPYNPQDGNSYFDSILLEDGLEKRLRGYCVDLYADAAIDFILTESNDPFFVVFAPNTPHHPLTVADRFAEPYRQAGLSEQTARFYGMISNIDYNVGRLLDAVEAKGASENTIVVFVGDNGTSSLHQQDDLWESGLRGRKSYVYENGIRVPMFIKLPHRMSGIARVETRGMVEDVMPTLLDLCGVAAPDRIDGRSLVPVIKAPDADWPDRPMFFQFHRGAVPEKYRHIAVISGDYKLVQPEGRKQWNGVGDARYELFNLAEDPFETQDLAGQHPELVGRLLGEYEQWFDDVCSEGFEPVRTWIGEDLNVPVTLTRQDWAGAGLFDGELGVHHLDVRVAGVYRMTLRWGHLVDDTHPVKIRLNDRIVDTAVLYAESECRLERVALEQGDLDLEAWIEVDGVESGFRYIHIERVD